MSFLPWFPFYVNDFWSDEAVMCMNNRQVGIYLRLLSLQWREGSIPDDMEKLAALCGEAPLEFQAQWVAVSGCFESSARHLEGRLVNSRLEAIRAEREAAHDAMSAGGKKGGKSKSSKKKQKPKPPLSHHASHHQASKNQNLRPPISPPQGDGQVADAGEDQDEDPTTAEGVAARWNAEAPKGKRKSISRLNQKELRQYFDRLETFPGFWQAIALELGRLNDLTRRKQWLTLRWLIKSDDNFGTFADGEYSDGSKVTDESQRRARLASTEREQNEKAQRDAVEDETLDDWPVGTRVKVISAKNAVQKNAVGTMGTVRGASLRQIVVTLDVPVKMFKNFMNDVFTLDDEQIQKEGLENGAAEVVSCG